MQTAQTQASTLRELLDDIRNGFALYAPVLISVNEIPQVNIESTVERTTTVHTPVNWGEQYTREYANQGFFMLGENSLGGGLEKPAKIGRSRVCELRLESDSVSKVHASITFDRNSGGYFVTDEESRNGTFINGERIKGGVRSSIWPGAYVSFGDAVFVFIDPPTLRKLSRLAG